MRGLDTFSGDVTMGSCDDGPATLVGARGCRVREEGPGTADVEVEIAGIGWVV